MLHGWTDSIFVTLSCVLFVAFTCMHLLNGVTSDLTVTKNILLVCEQRHLYAVRTAQSEFHLVLVQSPCCGLHAANSACLIKFAFLKPKHILGLSKELIMLLGLA